MLFVLHLAHLREKAAIWSIQVWALVPTGTGGDFLVAQRRRDTKRQGQGPGERAEVVFLAAPSKLTAES